MFMNGTNYNDLNSFYKKKFGEKVFKVSLDGGFCCPNKDGSKGVGGCIFCNGSVAVGNSCDDLKTQFETVKALMHKKWKDAKYIAFFEANTNTYGEVSDLRKMYEQVLSFEDVVGISIATRCDSISDEVYDYLEDLSNRTYLTIELGLQSAHDKTLRRINRGHTVDDFTKCVKELRHRNIDIVVHIINGLPGENEEMMLETIKYINSLGVQGIKFHMLYIEEGTVLAEIYKKNPFTLLTREKYIQIVGKQLALLNPEIVVHRLISGPDNRKLLAPKWLLGKFTNLNAIEKYLEKNNIVQGQKK